jgi:hypothetical protein
MVSEKGSALSRARAKTKRDDAWSWAMTCRRRAKMRRQQMVIAPPSEMAFSRM